MRGSDQCSTVILCACVLSITASTEPITASTETVAGIGKPAETTCVPAMQRLSLVVGLETTATVQTRTYVDEGAAVRTELCKAAGMTEDQAAEAYEALKKRDPELLKSILSKHFSLTEQVMMN